MAVAVAAPLTQAGAASVPVPPVAMPAEIEPLAKHDPARLCSPTDKPGAVRLAKLLVSTWPRTRAWDISRKCDQGGPSEHKEGRAFDWAARASVPEEKADVEEFFRWALASDSRGNTAAYARRLGIMYMIYNDRIWSATRANEGWRPYVHRNCANRPLVLCKDSLRHRDHVHISLSWAGAQAQTSFWTGKVAQRSSVPPTETRPAPRVRPDTTTSLTAYRHLVLRRGARGEAVVALQRALRMPDDGNFGPRTQAAVMAFQRSRGLSADGVVGPRTWAALGA